jgi:anaerobic magnesium-protoporphyrin IX monomethyl ester cyclase
MRILYLPNCWSQQRQREKKRWIYPVLLAMQAEWHSEKGDTVVWDDPEYLPYADRVITKPEDIDFLKLPAPNRVFTKAFNKKYQNNGNFKYRPGTYIQVANGCWWGKCEFCVEKKNKWQVRPVDDCIEELKECKRLGFKEVFDDSGTFPIGGWLDEFLAKYACICSGLIMGCNMRMVDVDYSRMRSVGFRMLLFGLESANQKTLDRINKGTKVEDVKYIKKAAKAGLDCHVACMVGCPGETVSESLHTVQVVKDLLRKGIAKTAQCSLYTSPSGEQREDFRSLVKKIYEVGFCPGFWFKKIRELHNLNDLKYLYRQVKEGLCG